MKIFRSVFAVAGIAMSIGCSTKSGVLPVGPNTYTISAGAVGSGSISGNNTMSKRAALTEANAYCASLGRQILVQNMSASSTGFGSTNDLVFRCLDPNEAAATRAPSYRRDPDLVIEHRNGR